MVNPKMSILCRGRNCHCGQGKEARIASGGALFTICPSPGSELGGDMNCEERVDTLRQLLAILRRCGEAEAELLAAEARSLISELQQYFFVLHMCSADTRHRTQIIW